MKRGLGDPVLEFPAARVAEGVPGPSPSANHARRQERLMSQTRIRLTRAELYEKVWATPMRTLAKEFGMSDVALAKACRKHDIPVPPVGYWRRKETGYNVSRPSLPASKAGTEHLDFYVRERLRPEFQELSGRFRRRLRFHLISLTLSH